MFHQIALPMRAVKVPFYKLFSEVLKASTYEGVTFLKIMKTCISNNEF